MAFTQAHAVLSETNGVDVAKKTFLDLIDRGILGAEAALSGTAYV